MIPRIARRELLQRAFKRQRAPAVRDGRKVFVEGLDSGNIAALAIRSGARGLCFLDSRRPRLQICVGGWFPQLMIVCHRHAPVRHAAGRIHFCNRRKQISGVLIPEGVEKGDGTIEVGLYLWIARDRKLHFAEVFRSRRAMVVLRQGRHCD